MIPGVRVMPYPRAHYWILLFLPPLVVAFWPTYFAPAATVQPAHHVHGITALLWLGLIAYQSWLIHNGRVAFHKQVGQASFVLFPSFMAGLFMVIHTNAVGLAGEPDAVRIGVGPNFSAVSAVVILTIGLFYFSALKTRRVVQLHARYLLATPILLIEPVTSRLISNFVPALAPSRDPVVTIANFSWAYYLSMSFVFGFTLFLYLRDRDHGRPFRLLAVLILVQVASYELLGGRVWWKDAIIAAFNRPMATVVTAGLATGALIVWLGWSTSSRLEFTRPGDN